MEKKEFAFMGKVVNGRNQFRLQQCPSDQRGRIGILDLLRCTFLYDRFHDA